MFPCESFEFKTKKYHLFIPLIFLLTFAFVLIENNFLNNFNPQLSTQYLHGDTVQKQAHEITNEHWNVTEIGNDPFGVMKHVRNMTVTDLRTNIKNRQALNLTGNYVTIKLPHFCIFIF